MSAMCHKVANVTLNLLQGHIKMLIFSEMRCWNKFSMTPKTPLWH